MKTFLAVSLALLASQFAMAQALSPAAVNGAVIGGVAGAVVGHHSGGLRHNSWRGAALGAGTGLVIGSIVGDSRNHYGARTDRRVHAAPRTYLYRRSGGYGHFGGYPSYSYGPRWHSSYYRPGYTYIDGGVYGYSSYNDFDGAYSRPNYAANGALWGALAGAVIGNNSGDLRHNGWRGAGYGAAAGYILGSIAENNARRREAALTQQSVAYDPSTPAPSDPAPNSALPPATVTTPEPRPSSSMSSANSLFGR